MGSRLHGNDGRTHNRHSRHGANPRPNIVIPAQAGIHGGGPAAMGSRLHGNDGRTHNRHSRAGREAAHGGNPRRGGRRSIPGGNDGRTHNRHSRHGGIHGPTSSFPRRRESTAGRGGDGFPSPRERRAHPQHRHSRHGANPRPNIVIPAHGHGGGPAAMGSRIHSRPTAGGGDGFPSPRERRAHPQSSFPSSFPRRRESTAGGRRRWVPVSTGTTGAPTIVIPATARIHGPTSSFPRTAGIHGGGPAAMGSRLHGNDGRTHNRHSRHGANPRPHIVIPARRESTAGGRRRWVPVSTGMGIASALIEWRRSGAAR